MALLRSIGVYVWGGFLPYLYPEGGELLEVQIFKWRVGLVGTTIGLIMMGVAKLMGA